MTEGSPLLEADPASLVELFNRDPLLYTKQDEDTIIRELRKLREAYTVAEAQGKKPRAVKAKAEKKDFSLDDLDL
jgi:hypothetical protein